MVLYVSSVMSSVVLRSLFNPSTRAATFTASPITVYFICFSDPTLPAKTEPVWMPMPILSV